MLLANGSVSLPARGRLPGDGSSPRGNSGSPSFERLVARRLVGHEPRRVLLRGSEFFKGSPPSPRRRKSAGGGAGRQASGSRWKCRSFKRQIFLGFALSPHAPRRRVSRVLPVCVDSLPLPLLPNSFSYARAGKKGLPLPRTPRQHPSALLQSRSSLHYGGAAQLAPRRQRAF